MKKKWSLIAAAAAALALAGCMLAGCGSNDAAKDSANSDTTKLIVGFDQSYPPYGFVGNDGNYTGFDLDLATEVCQAQLLGAPPRGHRLGRQGHPAQFGRHHLHLERLHHGGPRGRLHLHRALHAERPGRRCETTPASLARRPRGQERHHPDRFRRPRSPRGRQGRPRRQLRPARDHRRLQHRIHAARERCRRRRRLRPLHRPVPDRRQARAYTQLSDELSSEHYAVGFKKGNTELATRSPRPSRP